MTKVDERYRIEQVRETLLPALATDTPWPRLVDESRAASDAVLPHRLRPPRSLVSSIERKALMARLEAGLGGQVVAIHAPAGFGKTELLRAFYDRRRRAEDRFCWITVDAADSDPKVFLHDLAAAIAVANNPGDRPVRIPATDASLEELISAMRALLLTSAELVTILLDDFHVPQGTGFRDCFDLFLHRLPQETRVVLASRGKPDIPVSRLRVRCLLTEIAAEDLAFSRNELLRVFAGTITPGETQRILDVTGGWPALAQLARFALSSKPSAEVREEVLSGRHGLYSDFLKEEALAGVPESVTQALAVCAVLDSFPQDLVVNLAGLDTEPVTSALLANLSPALHRLRNPEGWLRTTPVLTAMLRSLCGPTTAKTFAALHIRAASWFAEKGIFDSAVRHAAHGRDFGMAVEAIRKAGGVNIFLRMGYTVLRRLLSDLPPDIIYESPELRLCQALMVSKEGQIQTARSIIESLKQDSVRNRAIPPADLEHIDGMIDIYEDKNLDDAQVDKLKHAAHDFRTYNTWERGWIYNHLCLAHQRSGDLRAARLTGLKALSCYQEENTPYAQIFMLGHLGTVLIAGGRLSAASNVLRQADQLVQETQWSDASISALTNIPRASCFYHQGEIVEASRLLGSALPVVTRGEGWVDIFARAFSTFARARFLQEGLEAGLTVLDQGEVLAIERALPRLEVTVDLARVELLTRANQFDLARHLLEKLPAIAGDDSDIVGWPTLRERHEAFTAKARLLVRTGENARGLMIAEALIRSADEAGTGLDLLAGRAIAIEALWGLGRSDEALAHLLGAVALAVPQKATQFMRDGDITLARVLRSLVRRAGLSNFTPEGAAFLATVLGPLQPRQMGDLSSTASMVLTRREAEVLAALSAGATNKRIAWDLGLTEAAVKFHMKNLFRKLGVSRRALAVGVARDMGLIPRLLE